MFERAGRSWSLMKEAWGVLRQDKHLVVFPILSGVFSLLALASFLIPILLSSPWAEISSSHGGSYTGSIREGLTPVDYLLLFLFYLVTYFIVVFFNSGLVACVRIRLAGGHSTLRDGLIFSLANIGRIFQWALLAATVGMILKALEDRLGWLGQLVVRLIGIAWTLATTFVVPVLVHERVGPIEAVKRSAQVFRRTWGEAVIANFGMGTAFVLLFLAGIGGLILGVALAASMAAYETLATTIFIGTLLAVLVYWIALAIVHSALQGIFLTACYQYAITQDVPTSFAREHIVEAWRPKATRKRGLF